MLNKVKLVSRRSKEIEKEGDVLRVLKKNLRKHRSNFKVHPTKVSVSIPVKHLKTFKKLQELQYEVGGWLDFNLTRKLERFLSWFGERHEVSFPTLDFEVDWHIHPTYSDGRVFNPPSDGDMIALVDNFRKYGTQLSIVFTDDGIYAFNLKAHLIIDLEYYTEKEVNKLEKDIRKAVDIGWYHGNKTGDISLYYTLIDNVGFDLKLVPYNKEFRADIFIVE